MLRSSLREVGVSGGISSVIHREILARVEAGVGAPITWQLGHERLGRNARERAGLDADEAVWLVACEALGAHRELAYGSFVEYVSAVVGVDAHSAHERIRVARALVRLPRVYEKLAASELSWSAIRELTRVATPETEAAWVSASAELRVRGVQKLVSGRKLGDLPESPVDEGARRHVVRFEVSGTTLAFLRQAQDEQRRRTGGSADDDTLIAELAHAYLSGADATGGAAAQIVVTVCPECEQAIVAAGGEAVTLTPAEVERHLCDARVVPTRQTDAVAPRSHVGPEREPQSDAVLTSHGGRERVSKALAEIERRAGLLVSTELPKTIRAAVIHRHGGKCAVPGCSNTGWLHLHHMKLLSEGGGHDPEHLVPLCEAHHRAFHDGRLLIDGSWSAGFRFTHADGTKYGGACVPDPRVSERAQCAFSVLKNLGFKERDARSVVDAIRDKLTPDMPLEEVGRLALQTSCSLPSMQRVFGVREHEAVYLPSSAA